MRRTSRKLPEFDLTTKCTECGYAIPPADMMRLTFDTAQCPKCKAVFTPAVAKPTHPMQH